MIFLYFPNVAVLVYDHIIDTFSFVGRRFSGLGVKMDFGLAPPPFSL